MPRNKIRRLYRVGQCFRRRLPLQLAWAITIHKSQGMSLSYLQVELGDSFAAGQNYVALSRAKTLEGLCVKSFDAEKVRRLISHEAKRFHDAVRAQSEVDAEHCGAPVGRLITAAGPLATYYSRVHFWWKEVVEGPSTHSAWADVFRSDSRPSATSFATEFRRWEAKFPVPERLRKLPPTRVTHDGFGVIG